MPYTIQDPPEAIKGLPKPAQEIFIAAFNNAWDEYDGNEAKCNATAWAAVKAKYKQNDKGEWSAMKEKLETVDIKDVEILAPGTWQGNKTVTVPPEAIGEFCASFKALSADQKLNYEPPAKLGHDDKQKILQSDGYPAAGWVSGLREKAGKLIADFRGVPKKLADIIKAGGYKKVSSEFYQDYEIGGKKWPWVLKAVAFLGADVPAVKTIGDIAAQYAELCDENGTPYYAVTLGEVSLDEIMGELDTWLTKAEGAIHGKAGSPAIRTYLKEVKAKLRGLLEKQGNLAEDDSLTNRVRAVEDAYYAQTRTPLNIDAGGWVKNVLEGYIIVVKSARYYQIPYAVDGDTITFQLDQAEEVKEEISYVKAAEVPAADADTHNQNNETEVFMEAELKKLLKLDEKADVLEAVKAIVEKKPAEGAVSLAEHTALQARLTNSPTSWLSATATNASPRPYPTAKSPRHRKNGLTNTPCQTRRALTPS
jgi:cation transport regulator